MFKINNKESQIHTISCGYHHSAAINKYGQLLVWGDNSYEQLKEKVDAKKDKHLKQPTWIRLKYGIENLRKVQQEKAFYTNNIPQHNDYKAIDVCAGNNCTFVIGQQLEQTFIDFENAAPEHMMILKELHSILIKDGNLEKFFEIEGDEDQNQDPFKKWVDTEKFIDLIIQKKICLNSQKVRDFARKISDHRTAKSTGAAPSSIQETLNLGDIEDHCLKFLQHNVKLFVFGQIHKCLGAFEQKINQRNELKNQQKLKDENDHIDDIIVVSNPTAIQFPRFTYPIISIACGAAHALAISINNKIYSWGSGAYGALGFGFREDVPAPRHIEMIDHRGVPYIITQVACGKYHSMCLTRRKAIFTWGKGDLGRLGHGNEEDQLVPKDIKALSQRKPIFIAAGESHSAAITEKRQLFCWGNGGFGRLGLGLDMNDSTPKQVEELDGQEVDFVALGSFHSIAVTTQGDIYSWGQNKYGKLGLQVHQLPEGQVCSTPMSITMNKIENNKNSPIYEKLVQLSAGASHSMAISEDGICYTWGYHGKGLLGRDTLSFHMLAIPVGGGFKHPIPHSLQIQTKLSGFITKYVQDQIKSTQATTQNKQKDIGHNSNFFVEQVCCSANNTYSLTNMGDIFVVGDNTFCQHAVEDLNAVPPLIDLEEGNGIYSFANISQIKIPQMSNLDKVTYIQCGGSHVFAKTELDEIYGWGKNDEGQLGIGYLTEKIVQPTMIKELSFKGVKQISCSDNYSAGLSIYGEVYVAGCLDGGKLGLGKGLKRGFQLEFTQVPGIPEMETISCGVAHMMAVARFNPNPEIQKQLRQTGKAWSWGKNHKGQLGIGNTVNKFSPTIIENSFERFKKVACGINFTLGLSITNKVYFWGNRKYNCDTMVKNDIEEPILLKSLEMDNVVDIAVDTKYCLVLLEKGEIKQWGKYLLDKKIDAAGFDLNEIKNVKKSKKDKEVKIEMIERFPKSKAFNVIMKQITTSSNHSCSISGNDKVYVWGHNNEINRLGLANQESSVNAEEQPEVLTFLEMGIQKIKEDKQAQEARNLISNSIQQKDKKEEIQPAESRRQESRRQSVAPITKTGRKETTVRTVKENKAEQDQNPEMDACEVIEEKDIILEEEDEEDMLDQGANSMQQDGDEPEQIQEMPVKKDFSQTLNDQIQSHNAKYAVHQTTAGKTGRSTSRGKNAAQNKLSVLHKKVDLFVLEFIRQELREMKESPLLVEISKINQNTTIIDANIILQKVLQLEEQQSNDEKSIGAENNNLKRNIFKILAQVLEFSGFHQQNKDILSKAKQSFTNRIVESPFDVDASESHTLSQKGIDSDYIAHKKAIQEIMLYLQMHPCYIIKLLKSDIFDFEQKKMIIKQVFKSNKKSGTERLNYLLVTVFQEMMIHELDPKTNPGLLENEDCENFNNPDNKLICCYIFRRIFKSQQTNVDTVCCIISHLANACITNFSKGQGNTMDLSLDVRNEMPDAGQKGGKNAATGGASKGQNQNEKAKVLGEFIQTNIEQLFTNQILKDQSVYFGQKSRVASQLKYLTDQFQIYLDKQGDMTKSMKDPVGIDLNKFSEENALAGVTPDRINTMFPAFRLSQEINLMIDMLIKHLNLFDAKDDKEEKVASQILGLLFAAQSLKIWDNYEIYLFPYLQRAKLMQFISDQFSKTQVINMKNIIHVFCCFLTGRQVFPEDRDQSWRKDIDSKLKQLQSQYKPQLINKLCKYGRSINNVVSYKNFEQQITHSLETEDSQIYISKKLLGEIIMGIFENQQQFSLQVNPNQDPLICKIRAIDQAGLTRLRKASSYDEIVPLKLKTRLFVSPGFDKAKPRQKDEILAKFVRCWGCNACMLEEMAVSNYDDNLVINDYEPQDKEGIMSQYCNILSKIDPIDKDLLGGAGDQQDKNNPRKKKANVGIKELIELAEINAKKTGQYTLADMIQSFMFKFENEVANLVNKQEKQINKEKVDEKKAYQNFSPEDQVTIDLLKEAESKIHERSNQKFYINLIQTETERYLIPEIKARMEFYKKSQITFTKQLYKNYQFGMGNGDFVHLPEDGEYSSQIEYMKKIIDFTLSQPKSTDLSQNLGTKNRGAIRGYMSLDVPTLIKNGTIVKVNLKELESLMPHCHLVFIESSEGQSIELKLIFKQVKKVMCGPDKILQEQIMMKFDIYPKKLKQMRQQIAKDVAIAKAKQKELDAAQTGLPGLGGLPSGFQQAPVIEMANLKFEENDTLEFDPDKFFALIAKMERQKAAYAMSEDDVATQTMKKLKQAENITKEKAEELDKMREDLQKGAEQMIDDVEIEI